MTSHLSKAITARDHRLTIPRITEKDNLFVCRLVKGSQVKMKHDVLET